MAKSGEEIALFYDPLGSADTVEYVNYSPQATDISYGRSYDASPNWVRFTSPTPDASNNPLQLEEQILDVLVVYPNPHDGAFQIINKSAETILVNAYNLRGAIVFSKELKAGEGESIEFTGSLILHYMSEKTSGSMRILSIR